MKKNEYVSPAMEIVEIEEKYSILAGSTPGTESGGSGGGVDGEYIPD